jgi:hypothetical protein
VLHLVRDLIALRRAEPDLRSGDYRPRAVAPGAWAWDRGGRVTVLASLGDDGATLEDVHGTMVAASDRRRRGERVTGTLAVGGWEAVVVVADGTR